MSNIDKQELRERYSEKPAPKCHICGSVMTIQRAGAGGVVYGCTGRIDKDGEGYKFAKGRDFADDHYARSRVTVADESDSDVLALLDELEAKDSMIAAQQHEIRTLLNALEGRPCPKCNDTGMADSGGTQPWGEPISVPCDCAAPPSPVAVPEGYRLQPISEYDAMCAAMLQGAENAESRCTIQTAPALDSLPKIAESRCSSPQVIPDCSCRTCRPVTMTDMRFVVCPDCGNKRCPHANDHRNACTGSNEPGQEGSAYPAAPQQEA
ncbi:ead/Ea22-like family protein [Enterobacter hormaechei]|nr:ead/Ea22-like family protein [Enterobacter hormaechei]HEM7457384.1 ead/Ea22-like family protein [Enterobacter hormaechei]